MKNIKKLPHITGIYKITNLINGHSYIGQSKDIYNRFNSHHICDYQNKNNVQYNSQLYQAFRKYGIENFKVEILEQCKFSELDEREIYWIDFYNTFKNGYNMTRGGQFWSPKIFSAETEEKRRATREKNNSLKSENHPRAKLSNEQVISIRHRYKNGESVESIWKDFSTLYPSKDVFRRIILGSAYQSVEQLNTEDIRYTNAKFTKEQVLDIRTQYYTLNVSCAELAKEYGVTAKTISNICDRISYAHIKDDIPDLRERKNYRLTPDQVRAIRKSYSEGSSFSELSEKYHIGESAIRKCCNRVTYKNID